MITQDDAQKVVDQGRDPKKKCDDFLFFEGRLMVRSSFTLFVRSMRLFAGGLLTMIRGMPDKVKSLIKRESTPGVVTCGVDYGRIGGVDLAHFPIMKESKEIYKNMEKHRAETHNRTSPQHPDHFKVLGKEVK